MCSNEKDPFGWGDFDREETNSDGQHFCVHAVLWHNFV